MALYIFMRRWNSDKKLDFKTIMAHKTKTRKAEDSPGPAGDEEHWKICDSWDFTYRRTSFPPNLIPSWTTITCGAWQYWILPGAEHMKRYPVNFGPKGYSNKKHAGVWAPARRPLRRWKVFADRLKRGLFIIRLTTSKPSKCNHSNSCQHTSVSVSLLCSRCFESKLISAAVINDLKNSIYVSVRLDESFYQRVIDLIIMNRLRHLEDKAAFPRLQGVSRDSRVTPCFEETNLMRCHWADEKTWHSAKHETARMMQSHTRRDLWEGYARGYVELIRMLYEMSADKLFGTKWVSQPTI